MTFENQLYSIVQELQQLLEKKNIYYTNIELPEAMTQRKQHTKPPTNRTNDQPSATDDGNPFKIEKIFI